mgnify:CR=1 FL=1
MSDQEKQGKKKKMEIELTKEEAPGTYSNLVMINHSPSEFVFDFISMMPAMPKAKVVKRMVLTPDHAKRLLNALQGNIKRFEEEHGKIEEQQKQDIPSNYFGPKPEA